MKPGILLISLIFALIASSCTSKTDPSIQWNQYLGPDRNASITGESIARSWTEAGPRQLWSIELGEGYGGAAIFGQEVFVLDREKGVRDILRCIDLESGQEKWNYSYDAEGELGFPGSRAVPTVDEEHIWCVGPMGHLNCIDKESGQVIWMHQVLEEFEGKPTQWGISQSPLLYSDLVIVAPEGDKGGVVAYNKLSGELVWKSRPLSGYSYHVSPSLANFGGIDQVVMISPYDRRDSSRVHEVVAFEAATGKELWTYKGLKSFATITPAVQIDERRMFFTDCSYNNNYAPVSAMIEITRTDGKFQVKELFLTEEAGCKMHPGVVFEDHIYLNSTGRPARMQCMTLDGKLTWQQDSVFGFEMGGMILINDLIVNQDGKSGDLVLIEPSPDAYREVGRISPFPNDKSQAWAPLAFSQGRLIARDLTSMVCLDLR